METPVHVPTPKVAETPDEPLIDPAIPRGVHRLLSGIFLIMLVAALYLAADILLPVSIAFLLAIVFFPLVRWLRGHGIPEVVSALTLIAAMLLALAAAVYFLAAPVQSWIADAPRIGREIQEKIAVFRGTAESIAEATQQVEAIAAGPDQPADGVQRVELSEPGLLDSIFLGVPSVVAKIALTLVVLLFVLASGDMFHEKLVKVMPTLSDKKRAVRIYRNVEYEVSRYFLTISMINLGFGFSVGVALFLVGWSTPAMWGLAAVFLNFIPYLGGLIAVVLMGLVGLVTFDTIPYALLGPAIYITLNVVENSFVTPLVVGRRLEINPVIILLGVTFWGWLWGIAGLLIAVPLLVVGKAFADNIESWAPMSEFLGARQPANGEAGNGQQAGK